MRVYSTQELIGAIQSRARIGDRVVIVHRDDPIVPDIEGVLPRMGLYCFSYSFYDRSITFALGEAVSKKNCLDADIIIAVKNNNVNVKFIK